MRAERSLIITCEQCDTRFQLDPSKVPAQGARVRCSRCKHVFQVTSPTASFDEALHDVALEAARQPVGVPDAAQDPEPEGDPFADTMQGVGFDVSIAGGPRPTGMTGEPREPETHGQTLGGAEEDWEFNDEPPTQVVDTTAPDPNDESGSIMPDRRREVAAAPPVGEDDFDLGGLDDLGSDDDGEEEEASDDGTTDEDLFGGLDDLIGEDAVADSAAGSRPTSEPVSGEAVSGARFPAGMEGTDAWSSEADDLVDAGFTAAGPDESATARHADLAEATESVAATAQLAESPHAEQSARREPQRRSFALRWSEQWTTAVGSTVVGMLLVAAVVSVAADAVREPVATPFSPGLVSSGLRVDSLGSRIVDNVHVGSMLVVTGQLEQTLSQGHQALRVVLLDASGGRLQEAWAGPALGERWIREVAPEDIQAELESRSGQFAFMGGRIQAVFPAPPTEAADFLVETAPRVASPAAEPAPVDPTAQAADVGD